MRIFTSYREIGRCCGPLSLSSESKKHPSLVFAAFQRHVDAVFPIFSPRRGKPRWNVPKEDSEILSSPPPPPLALEPLNSICSFPVPFNAFCCSMIKKESIIQHIALFQRYPRCLLYFPPLISFTSLVLYSLVFVSAMLFFAILNGNIVFLFPSTSKFLLLRFGFIEPPMLYLIVQAVACSFLQLEFSSHQSIVQ